MANLRSTEELAGDLNVQYSDQSEASSEDTDSITDPDIQDLNGQSSDVPEKTKKPAVQALNIQLLDRRKIIIYILTNQDKQGRKDLESLSLVDCVDEFIKVYNEKDENVQYSFVVDRTTDYCLQKTYECQKSFVADIQKSEKKNPQRTEVSNFILFFFIKDADESYKSVFAATTREAWGVVRPCANYNFPTTIIDRVGSPDKIVRLERRYLFGSSTKEILLKPRNQELHKTSSLFYRVENLVCEIDEKKKRGAELFELLKMSTGNSLNDSTTDNEHEKSNNVSDDSEDDDENSRMSLDMTNSSLAEPLLSSTISDETVDENKHEQHAAGPSNRQSESRSPPKKKKKEGNMVKADKKGKQLFRIKITTSGSVSILRKIEVPNYILLIKLFNECLRDRDSIMKKFDFLHFFKTAKHLQSTLDDALLNNIFERFIRGKKLYVDVQHKCYEDFLLANKYEIKMIDDNHFKDIGAETPDINKIVLAIKTTDLNIFKDQMKNGQLRSDKTKAEKIINCLEGELYYNNENYFKIGKVWYQTDADYLSLLHQDFEKVMDELFIEKDKEGSLPKIWYKNDNLTETNLNAALNFGSGIRAFMKKLKTISVFYVLNDEVKQNELVGEILKESRIKVYKNEIEAALKKCPIGCSEDVFKGYISNNQNISDDDLDVIWKELIKERKIIYEKNEVKKVKPEDKANKETAKKVFVANPFPYPLEEELNNKFKAEGNRKYEELGMFLSKLCGPHQGKEEDYNRSYYEGFKPPLGSNYIVFDQILPDGIEPCDIFSYNDKSLYLYHVKEKFSNQTRDVCSQILNAATHIHEALRSNQPYNYLKRLWVESMTESPEEWRKITKSRLENIGEKNFMDMFRYRDIVFVYAYRTPRGFKKSYEHEKLSELVDNACKKTGFLNEYGFLTSKFFHNTKNDFVNEIVAQFPIEKTDCEAARDILKNRGFSSSTIAKMEIIRLEEKLRTFQNRFKLKVCEILSE